MNIAKHLALVLVLGVVAAAPSYAAMDDAKPFEVTSTSFGAKGSFKAIVEAFHAIYRNAYPGTAATAKPSSSAGGMVAVAKGESDIHYSVTTIDYEYGLAGKSPFQEKMPDGKLLHMFTLMDNLDLYYLARKKWADSNGIKTIADIARVKPKMNLGINRKGILLANVTIADLFDAYGFSPEDVLKWGGNIAYNASRASLQDLRDGKTDLMIEFGIQPDARIVDISKTRDLIWLQPDREVLEKIAAKRDISNVDDSRLVLQLPDKRRAHAEGGGDRGRQRPCLRRGRLQMVKAVAENMDRVQAIHSAFKNYSKQSMIAKPKAMGYHPGATTYYRERGWIN